MEGVSIALIQSIREGPLWEDSNCEEVGRLAQGLPPDMPKGTDTIRFINYDSIPNDRRKDITYLRIVCADRPQKSNPRRVRWTCGGDRINYPFDVSTKTADLLTAKILFNSTISAPGAKFCCFDFTSTTLCIAKSTCIPAAIKHLHPKDQEKTA